MNAANIDNSLRLQRVFRVLRKYGQLSTREIMRHADVCAVNSCVAELRANGHNITCRRLGGNFFYRLEA